MKAQHTIWLGLGANLGDRAGQIHAALDALTSDGRLQALESSSLWAGPYVGAGARQAEYYNLCARATTNLAPRALLDILHSIERSAGRPERSHSAPRVLDIDLLLFDTLCLEADGVILPHPRMRQRRFVLAPMAELDATLALPPDGTPLLDLLRSPEIAGQELREVVEIQSWQPAAGESRN